MSKMTLKYNGELRVNLIHDSSGVSINSDAPVDNNGLGQSFSPTDLVSSSLAACMITIIGIHNEKKSWGINSMNANLEKFMSSNPRRISKIKIDLAISGAPENEVIRASIMELAKNCPVALSLSDQIEQDVSIDFT